MIGGRRRPCLPAIPAAVNPAYPSPWPSSRAGPVRVHETLKTPPDLQHLVDDGVIDEVLQSLKSGKEATVYVVRTGADLRCAKVYRNMAQRSFQKRAQYQEGRKVRGSRQARAIGKSTSFGRKEQEAAWKNAEVDALYQLVAAGVRVPRPHGYFDGVLIMELVTDPAGNPAPRLGEVELPAETAREYHAFLIKQVVRMLCIGLVHGDLSEFNVLVAPDGPVIIDLPQAVDAAGNNNASAMLRRDADNITAYFSRFAPVLASTQFGKEIWALYERGALTEDAVLTGHVEVDARTADVAGVLREISDVEAEHEARLRYKAMLQAQ